MTGPDVEQMTQAELQALLLGVKDRVDQLLAERQSPAERRVVGGAS